MRLTDAQLGARLRAAREAAGLSQAQVAEQLGLSRPTVSLIEAGGRRVTSREMAALARLFGRTMEEFFQDQFEPQAALSALFRAQLGADAPPRTLEAAGRCLDLGRELTRLEALLDLSRSPTHDLPRISTPAPTTVMDAVQQGEATAAEERRRLGLGDAPVADLAGLLESHGVRTGVAELPEEVDGVTLNAPEVGTFVVVNGRNRSHRRRFSLAHECAHVLLDWREPGRISTRQNVRDPREVRANAFAAAFLMPEMGVLEALASLGKGPRRNVSEVFDGEGGLRVRNTRPSGAQELQIFDVAQLADRFGVSRDALLFRLVNLGVVTAAQREALKAQLEAAASGLDRVWVPDERSMEKLPQESKPQPLERRLVLLAIEALRLNKISRRRALELGELAGLDRAILEDMIEAAGLGGGAHEPVIPAGWR